MQSPFPHSKSSTLPHDTLSADEAKAFTLRDWGEGSLRILPWLFPVLQEQVLSSRSCLSPRQLQLTRPLDVGRHRSWQPPLFTRHGENSPDEQRGVSQGINIYWVFLLHISICIQMTVGKTDASTKHVWMGSEKNNKKLINCLMWPDATYENSCGWKALQVLR